MRFPLWLFMGLLCCSCSNSQSSEAALPPTEFVEAEATSPPMEADLPGERKIIQRATIRLQVENLSSSTRRVESITKELDGYIASSDENHSEYRRQSQLSVRVPAERLDTFLLLVEPLGIFMDYKNRQAQDVTEEYIDVETRLGTRKAVRDRYLRILREDARTVADILEAEEKIRVIQEDIEAAEGRIRYLANQVALSTVAVELYQVLDQSGAASIYRKPFGRRILERLATGWRGIQQAVLFGISLWPLWLILLAFFGIRRYRRNQS